MKHKKQNEKEEALPGVPSAQGAETAAELAEEAPEASAQKTVLRKIWDSTGYLIVPIVAMFLLLGVFFSLAWVPSSSMEPTLPTKSYFLGWRLPYFLGNPTPERGDIVMFRSDELGELLVKRVIGLPGDVVTLEGGYVYVNGEALEEDYLSEEALGPPMSPARATALKCRRAASL